MGVADGDARPALGRVVAGWVLLVAVLIRSGIGDPSPEAAESAGRAGPWLAYYALQLIGGLWSANVEAWAFSLEVKASLLFLPLVAGIPGRSLGDFWWSVGWALRCSCPRACCMRLGITWCWETRVSGPMPGFRGRTPRI